MLWVVVWEYKVEEGDSRGDGKASVWNSLEIFGAPLTTPGPHFFSVSLVALFLGQPLYLNYSTAKEVAKRKTWSLLFLKNTLLKVILLTKRHILG